jgi:energy-coupling factor transport system permease protein
VPLGVPDVVAAGAVLTLAGALVAVGMVAGWVTGIGALTA